MSTTHLPVGIEPLLELIPSGKHVVFELDTVRQEHLHGRDQLGCLLVPSTCIESHIAARVSIPVNITPDSA